MWKLPTTYLGMPLGSNHKALEIWDGILEKTEKSSLDGRLNIFHLEDD